MKTKKCIFTKMISMAAISAIIGGAYISHHAYAAIDNTGCDNEYNLYINPDLALCSTHVYNIGKTENDSATRQLMQDVVALKTTLITQQMYSQYEILETTVKRLRTQLQKEVLLAKLKSASAAANGGSYNDSSNGNSASNDRNVVLAGAQNCASLYIDPADVLNCEITNLNLVLSSVSSNRGDAARQLEKDLAVIDRIIKEKDSSDKYVGVSIVTSDCDNFVKRNSKKEQDITDCIYAIRTSIGAKLRTLNNSNNQQRGNPGY